MSTLITIKRETKSLIVPVKKVLRGSLKETLYAWPDQKKVEGGEPAPLSITRETVYQENEVTYISDKVEDGSHERDGRRWTKLTTDQIGLHKITNLSADQFAISLHCKTSLYLSGLARVNMIFQCIPLHMRRILVSTFSTQRLAKQLTSRRPTYSPARARSCDSVEHDTHDLLSIQQPGGTW